MQTRWGSKVQPPSANGNFDHPSDASSDLQQGVIMAESPLPPAAEVDSDDPANAFSDSPSSAAFPLPSPDVDDLIEAFSYLACSMSPINSGSFESDSCSPASAFSDFPTHAHGSYQPGYVVNHIRVCCAEVEIYKYSACTGDVGKF